MAEEWHFNRDDCGIVWNQYNLLYLPKGAVCACVVALKCCSFQVSAYKG